MRVLAIGDCHFKTSNGPATEAMTQALWSLVEERKPDFVVVLGDTLDRHESIHVQPLARAVTFLEGLAQRAPTYLLIGNHDRPNNSDFLSPFHPFLGLEHTPNLTIAANVVAREIQGELFLFVPYVPPGRFREALATCDVDYQKARAIFAHQEFRGAKMGAIISQTGDVWGVDEPLVISGHIHDYDLLQPNIIYTGTPLQHAFGDREDKTVSLFTFSSSMEQERIDLRLPRKKIIRLPVADFIRFTLTAPPENTELKIIVSGSNSDLKSLLKGKTSASWEKVGVKIAYREIADTTASAPIITNASYHEQLWETIKEDDQLVKLFTELFGPGK